MLPVWECDIKPTTNQQLSRYKGERERERREGGREGEGGREREEERGGEDSERKVSCTCICVFP